MRGLAEEEAGLMASCLPPCADRGMTDAEEDIEDRLIIRGLLRLEHVYGYGHWYSRLTPIGHLALRLHRAMRVAA